MSETKKGFLRENLPWIAPTLAIVALGTGVFDRIAGQESGTIVASLLGREAPAAEVTRNAPIEPGFPSYKDIGTPSGEVMASDVIAALVSAQGAAAAAPGPEPVAIPVAAAPAEPEPEPAATPVVAAPAAPEPLFGSASSANPDRGRCIEDLRLLSADARVYFPSGGVTGAEDGIAQARLLGLVAQDCPGVTIQVEGHSDPSGDPAANLRLSEERAQAVIDRVSAAGIDTSMFRAVGYGDRQPATIRGSGPSAYYDRRVEFSIVAAAAAPPANAAATPANLPICVTRLQDSVAGTRVFYAPRSIAVSQSDLSAAFQLAAAAAACPEARLRVVGQFSDDAASGETPATARMRAIAMMSMLVASGFESDQIIIAAPSEPTKIASAPGISDSRVDFDVIYDPN